MASVSWMLPFSTAPLIVVDNTNVRLWEMQPYVESAIRNRYQVVFAYPDTPWANDPHECFRKNQHGVPLETIVRMHDSWEDFRTVDEILNAKR